MTLLSIVSKLILREHIYGTKIISSIFTCRAYCTGLKPADNLPNGKNITKEPRLRQEPGLRFHGPDQKALRDRILDSVVTTCRKYGAKPLETPLLELTALLETDSEQLCHVVSRGEELCSLRPNLKIPHARYLACQKLHSTKLYQYGPVYRKMPYGPQERLLCDFDISGHHDPMMADSECAMFLVDALNSLDIDKYAVKVRHRTILEGILESCGITSLIFQVIWQNVARWDGPTSERGNLLIQLMQKIGIGSDAAQKLKFYLFMLDGELLLQELLADPMFSQQPKIQHGVNQMLLFLKYCQLFGIKDKISFDLSCSHHPEFYNGVLFDVICRGNVRVAEGGRYDGLVEKLRGMDVPCVGVSLDIDNLLSLKMNEVPTAEYSVPECSAQSTILRSSSQANPDLPDGDEDFKTPVKTPRGMKDYGPQKMVIRNMVLATVRDCFRRHGAASIDSPVVEPQLTNDQYGEESHLVFHLDAANQSLRYDLTVPLARYLAHVQTAFPFIRYQIGRVYRRDKPYTTKGRMREFYQCDYDVAGTMDVQADVQCIHTLTDVLEKLDVGPFVIKVSHRQVLDGLLEVCGVPKSKIRSICSSIDKLDKVAWPEVYAEMTNVKGLDPQIAEMIGSYVLNTSCDQVLKLLGQDEKLSRNLQIQQGLENLTAFAEQCRHLGLDKNVELDLRLARGLDYYTGLIFEAKLTQAEYRSSIAGGGRFDNLVGAFSSRQVPCVGVSIGVERLFHILEAKMADLRTSETEVFVASAHKNLMEERFKIRNLLLQAGFKVEGPLKVNPKLLGQFQTCEALAIPWAVVLGKSELDRGSVLLRSIPARLETEVPISSLVDELKSRLADS